MRALSDRFDELLGPAGRRLMYVHMFGQRELMLRFNDQGVPAWEDRVLRVGLPLFVRLVSRVLDIRPGVEQDGRGCRLARARPRRRAALGRAPLPFGERFTAADLTFAALSAPLRDAAATTASRCRSRRSSPRAPPGWSDGPEPTLPERTRYGCMPRTARTPAVAAGVAG